MDGVILTSRLPDVLRRTFHAGDGNLHPLIMFEASDLECFRKAELLTGSEGASRRPVRMIVLRTE